MRLITSDDFTDVYQKFLQRGGGFILSKFNLNKKTRTLTAFDNTSFSNSNWWIIPKVRERWNEKITGEVAIEYEQHVLETYLKGKEGLRMLSLGSGVCSHEMKFARSSAFEEVSCVDIAANLLREAKLKADQLGLTNMRFLAEDLYSFDLGAQVYDIVFFHASLHHFQEIETLITEKVQPCMKPGGLLIINEYVGPDMLQFSAAQIDWVNKALAGIPKRLRKRFRSNLYKNSFAGSGVLRMILADPSECVESSTILPVLHKHFSVLEEKPYGGNILMNALKDISHNFVDETDEEAQAVLTELFSLEDEFLTQHDSDFLFGVYRFEG